MNNNNEQYQFLKKLLIKKGKSQKIKMLASCFLNFFISDVFNTFGLRGKIDISYCSIIKKMLIDKEEAISNISNFTFYTWFKKIVEDQDVIRANLISSSTTQIMTAQVPSSKAEYNSAQNAAFIAVADKNQATAAPEPVGVKNHVSATVSNNALKNSAKTVAENDLASNDWDNGDDDLSPEFLTIDELEAKKKEQEHLNYLNLRRLYCPLPALPLTPLKFGSPEYPFKREHQKLFIDSRGLLFDGCSCDNESEYSPIPKNFEVNAELGNIEDNDLFYIYRYSGKDNGGRETYLSCSSKELVSYVLKNYGEMSTKKCVFWKV